MKTIYVPARFEGDIKNLLQNNLSSIKKYGNITVTATAQHLHDLDYVMRALNDAGHNILSTSQILGCRRDSALNKNAKTDCYIHLGGGRFHPLILAVESKKPVFLLNPIAGTFDEIKSEEIEDYQRKKKTRMKRAAGAKIFAVCATFKPGQEKMDYAFKLRNALREKGYEAFVFIGNEISPINMNSFKIDCIVNTACPRISEDHFEKPVVNPDELSEIFEITI